MGAPQTKGGRRWGRAWEETLPGGLCTDRYAWKADASPRMSKAGLELGDTGKATGNGGQAGSW